MSLSSSPEFEIKQFDFTSEILESLDDDQYVNDLWPIVYILSDETINEAYIGETTDTYQRISTHLKHASKSKLTQIRLITSEQFNKSVTLDIESNLIKYIAGDGKYKLLNGNLGIANHTYYQKKKYWKVFTSLWKTLRTQGITKHSINFIDNSDLFKYSPYKSLSVDQRKGLLSIMESLLDDSRNTVIVEGSAGTGKTILALFLFKILNSSDDINFKEFSEDQFEFITVINHLKYKFPNPKMALVVPMTSFRNTLKKVFKNIKGLKSSMVIGPTEAVKEKYDILIVDESHRLRRRRNIVNYASFDKACESLGLDKMTANELDFVNLQSSNLLLFYDENQSIKPSDVPKEYFDKLKNLNTSKVEKLVSQFRVKGGNSYLNFITRLLSSDSSLKKYSSSKYELLLYHSIDEMVSKIKEKNEKYGLSRLIAGFAWPWISRKNTSLFDISINGTELRWNNTTDDWINSENAVNEVGCIHTSQGYDLNYTGVIFGPEVIFNPSTKKIEIIKENYHDKNGKNSIKNPQILEDYILNIYKTIMLRGIRGTYIYACDNNLRDYLAKSIMVADQIEPPTVKTIEKIKPYINSVPLYGLEVAAGAFSEQQLSHEVDKEFIHIPDFHKPSKDLFACKIVGESMNKIIPNNSICLFSKYTGGSRNGLIVLAEHSEIQDSDSGSNYTVKEYHSTKKQSEEGWSHISITLKPLSTNSEYENLVLEEDDLVGFKVIGIFKGVISHEAN